MRPLVAILIFCCTLLANANEWRMPQDQFERFKNRRGPDGSGSCVYAANSMAGAHHGVAGAEYFMEPWNGQPACLGGSYPGRFVKDCQARGIKAYSIEGPETLAWIAWGLKKGGYVGITYGQAHMICAIACAEDESWFEIVDNNFPSEGRRVDRATFIREHRLHGGGWCTILDTPGPPPWARAQSAEPW